MMRARGHRSYWAFVGHRISGLALAAFLPFHFLVLALTLRGAETLDYFLFFTELWPVKIAEWGLVTFLAIHMFFGSRLLMLELLPWRSPRADRAAWILPSLLASLIIGGVFLAGVM